MRYYFVAALILSGVLTGVAKFAGPYISLFDIEFSNLELVLIGTLAFCVLMVLFLSLETLRLNRKLSNAADGLTQFETDMARRMSAIDTMIVNLKSPSKHGAVEEIRWTMAPDNEMRKIVPADRNIPIRSIRQSQENQETKASLPDGPDNTSIDTGNELPTEPKQTVDIAQAVRDGQVISWYQPVVTLPERTTRYLDARPYLHIPEGGLLSPEEWLADVKPKSLRAEIDIQTFDQAIALARDLDREDRKIGVILRLAWHETSRPSNVNRFLNLAAASSSVSDKILLEITLPEYFQIDRKCLNVMANLRELGFQLAISQCGDGEQTEDAIQSGFFSYVIPDPILLMSPDHLAMFKRLKYEPLDEQDIQLEIIARSIENEEAAIEMIDQNILLAQGSLFSPARPLKSDAATIPSADHAM
ncbi:MAG: EAL domain-containing protein [Pseudomonadota bacterium]